MNLAEIRKKARRGKGEQADLAAATPASATVESVQAPDGTCPEEAVRHVESLPLGDPVSGEEGTGDAVMVDGVHQDFDPLAVLLAGRQAAGSAADTVAGPRGEGAESADETLKYLRFRVDDEEYGVSLLEIREIIKVRAVTEVPRMPDFVAGIISLRGAIIPVLDLRLRLGMTVRVSFGQERIIIAGTGHTACGLLVDEVYQVIGLRSADIEKAPQVLDAVDREFVTGIGRYEGRMIILLDLEKIMNVSLR